MTRTHLFFPEKLLASLKKAAKKEGISVSELVRRIVTAYFQ